MEECAAAMKDVAQLQASNVHMQERIVLLEAELSQQRAANITLKKEVAANKVDLQDKQAAILSLRGSTKNCLELQAKYEKLAGELKEEKDQHCAKSKQLASAQLAMATSGEQMKVRRCGHAFFTTDCAAPPPPACPMPSLGTNASTALPLLDNLGRRDMTLALRSAPTTARIELNLVMRVCSKPRSSWKDRCGS